MTYISRSIDFVMFARLGQFLSNYWFYNGDLALEYILAWSIEYSHPYLILTYLSRSISCTTLS